MKKTIAAGVIALTLAGSALTPGTPLADPQPDRGFTIDNKSGKGDTNHRCCETG